MDIIYPNKENINQIKESHPYFNKIKKIKIITYFALI